MFLPQHRKLAIVLMVMLSVLLTQNSRTLLAAPPPHPPGVATSIVATTEFARLLSLLPALPLDGENGGMISYANVGLQVETIYQATELPADEALFSAWLTLSTAPTFARYLNTPTWEELFGFTIGDIDQTLEYFAPPLYAGIIVGQFNRQKITATWENTGYRSVTTGEATYYSIRDDYELDLQDASSQMTLAMFNNLGFLDDNTIVYSPVHGVVEDIFRVKNGQASSIAQNPSLQSILPHLPDNLVSGLIADGSSLLAQPEELADAAQMPPIALVFLGATAGGPINESIDRLAGKRLPQAKNVIALTMLNETAAAGAVPVIEQRLATGHPLTTGSSGPSFKDIYAKSNVNVVTGEPIVLIELTPISTIKSARLFGLFMQRSLNFLTWNP